MKGLPELCVTSILCILVTAMETSCICMNSQFIILKLTYSYAPFSYNLFLIYLAFGIIAGDPGRCHVTPELGA